MSIDPSILDGFGISEKDIHTFVTSNVGLCGIDGSRLSKFLLAQLTSAWKHRSLNTFAVTDVIQHLEGRSPYSGKTAKPRQFKGDALRGLWKVHFVDARFLLRNIYNEWEMFSAKSDKFDKLCARVAAAEEENPSPLGWQGRLAHEFVTGGIHAASIQAEVDRRVANLRHTRTEEHLSRPLHSFQQSTAGSRNIRCPHEVMWQRIS